MQLLLLLLILVHGNAATATKANSCTGNSATASKLATARNIKLQGTISGNANFDGSSNVIIDTIQNNIAILTGTIKEEVVTNYPSGYNKNNCVVLTAMLKSADRDDRSYGYGAAFDSKSYVNGSNPIAVYLKDSNIEINAKRTLLSADVVSWSALDSNFTYKIILMKIS